MADWQPIETAPKDGTRILLWDTDEVVIAKWDDISMGGAEGWQIAVVNMLSGLKHYEAAFNPTHWMPLPVPPRDYANSAVPGDDTGGAGGVRTAGSILGRALDSHFLWIGCVTKSY